MKTEFDFFIEQLYTQQRFTESDEPVTIKELYHMAWNAKVYFNNQIKLKDNENEPDQRHT